MVIENNRNSSKCVNPVWNIWAQSCQQVYKIYMPSKGSVNLVWLWMGDLCICLVYKKSSFLKRWYGFKVSDFKSFLLAETSSILLLAYIQPCSSTATTTEQHVLASAKASKTSYF